MTLLKHFYPLAALQVSSLCLCSDLTVCAFYLTLRIPARVSWLKGNAQCWLNDKIASTDYLCFDTLLNSGKMTFTTPLGHISNEGGRCRNWYFQVERLWDIAVLTQAYCWLEVLTSWQRWVSPHRCLQSDQQSGTRGGGRQGGRQWGARRTNCTETSGGRSPGENDLATQSLRLMRPKSWEWTRENWFVQTGLELVSSTLVNALEFSLGQQL